MEIKCRHRKIDWRHVSRRNNKDLEEIKNRQLAIKNEGINSRITEAKEQISELEYRMVEITETEQNREKQIKRNEDSLRDIKCPNIQIIQVPEDKDKKKRYEKIFEIIARNFPNGKGNSNPIPESPESHTIYKQGKHTNIHISQTKK